MMTVMHNIQDDDSGSNNYYPAPNFLLTSDKCHNGDNLNNNQDDGSYLQAANGHICCSTTKKYSYILFRAAIALTNAYVMASIAYDSKKSFVMASSNFLFNLVLIYDYSGKTIDYLAQGTSGESRINTAIRFAPKLWLLSQSSISTYSYFDNLIPGNISLLAFVVQFFMMSKFISELVNNISAPTESWKKIENIENKKVLFVSVIISCMFNYSLLPQLTKSNELFKANCYTNLSLEGKISIAAIFWPVILNNEITTLIFSAGIAATGTMMVNEGIAVVREMLLRLNLSNLTYDNLIKNEALNTFARCLIPTAIPLLFGLMTETDARYISQWCFAACIVSFLCTVTSTSREELYQYRILPMLELNFWAILLIIAIQDLNFSNVNKLFMLTVANLLFIPMLHVDTDNAELNVATFRQLIASLLSIGTVLSMVANENAVLFSASMLYVFFANISVFKDVEFNYSFPADITPERKAKKWYRSAASGCVRIENTLRTPSKIMGKAVVGSLAPLAGIAAATTYGAMATNYEGPAMPVFIIASALVNGVLYFDAAYKLANNHLSFNNSLEEGGNNRECLQKHLINAFSFFITFSSAMFLYHNTYLLASKVIPVHLCALSISLVAVFLEFSLMFNEIKAIIEQSFSIVQSFLTNPKQFFTDLITDIRSSLKTLIINLFYYMAPALYFLLLMPGTLQGCENIKNIYSPPLFMLKLALPGPYLATLYPETLYISSIGLLILFCELSKNGAKEILRYLCDLSKGFSSFISILKGPTHYDYEKNALRLSLFITLLTTLFCLTDYLPQITSLAVGICLSILTQLVCYHFLNSYNTNFKNRWVPSALRCLLILPTIFCSISIAATSVLSTGNNTVLQLAAVFAGLQMSTLCIMTMNYGGCEESTAFNNDVCPWTLIRLLLSALTAIPAYGFIAPSDHSAANDPAQQLNLNSIFLLLGSKALGFMALYIALTFNMAATQVTNENKSKLTTMGKTIDDAINAVINAPVKCYDATSSLFSTTATDDSANESRVALLIQA